MSPPGLYIHIPFCISKCHYCGFYSLTDLSLVEEFLSTLEQEINHYSRLLNWQFDTVYIGGGTPSVLSPGQLERLVTSVRNAFTILPGAEFTLEVNPADINYGFARILNLIGINRISIGVQSFADDILTFLGRRHRSEAATDSVNAVRKAGFENISLDLIYSIPGQNLEAWRKTLDQAIALAPEHLSCYQLTVEEGTPLCDRVANGNLLLPDDDLQAEFFFGVAETLEAGGYVQYEISNFALPGRESRHNRKYWDHSPYLGLGPSAHSFAGNERWWNMKNVKGYCEALKCGNQPTEGREKLDDDKLRFERLFLGLRTSAGINLDGFRNRYGVDLLAEKKEAIARLQQEGFLELSGGFLKPTRRGMAVADGLALM